MNIRMKISYNGLAYKGFQIQPGLTTIQEKLENALSRLYNYSIRVTVAGRTDAGVHALGQVVNAHVPEIAIPVNNIRIALNHYLPHDIRIRKVCLADPDFSARYSAVGKTYAYAILNREADSVFWSRRAFHERRQLNFEKMRQAADLLTGIHEFKNFSTRLEGHEKTVRSVDKIQFRKWGPYILIVYRGRSFLRGMVRMLTGAILSSGLGHLELSKIKDLLECRSSDKVTKVPAWGLYLVRVRY
jgi:tRNA pseudouridine38-40 synthase